MAGCFFLCGISINWGHTLSAKQNNKTQSDLNLSYFSNLPIESVNHIHNHLTMHHMYMYIRVSSDFENISHVSPP